MRGVGILPAMRALVTGMTGFVGGHLVASLLADGFEVHGTLLPSVAEVAPAGTSGTPVEITDTDAMANLIARFRPDVVFHLAGAASVGQSFDDPLGTWRVNVEGTRGVLGGVLRSAPTARTVVALSGEQYGRVSLEDLPVDEDTPQRPLSPYAESKVAADALCAEYVRDHGLAVIRLRAFNQIGPGQDSRFVLPSICRQIAQAELAAEPACHLHLGNLDTRRDFLDVRDVVRAYRLLAADGDPSRPYIAARGESRPVRDLVDIAVALARLPVEISTDPLRVRAGEQADLYANPRALRELGWEPALSIHQSIADTLEYWRVRMAGSNA